jgi:hypothetical protein
VPRLFYGTCAIIIIYEISARRHFSRMSPLFEERTLCLICRIPFVNRMALVHTLAKVSIEIIEFIILKSNYFQNAQKGECFLDDFQALVREIYVRALVLQNGLRAHSSARTSISRTTMQSRNVILKVVSSKIVLSVNLRDYLICKTITCNL